jgi:hypothetical protein
LEIEKKGRRREMRESIPAEARPYIDSLAISMMSLSSLNWKGKRGREERSPLASVTRQGRTCSEDNDDRTEDLLLDDSLVRLDVLEHRRLDEEALGAVSLAASG